MKESRSACVVLKYERWRCCQSGARDKFDQADARVHNPWAAARSDASEMVRNRCSEIGALQTRENAIIRVGDDTASAASTLKWPAGGDWRN